MEPNKTETTRNGPAEETTSDAGSKAANTGTRFTDSPGQRDSEVSTGREGSAHSFVKTPGPDKAASQEVVNDDDECWYQLGFAIARSLRYHAKRRAFFERCNHLTRVFSALGGAGTVAMISRGWPLAIGAMGAIVGTATALDLVFDFSKRAMIYDELYRRFADIGIKVAAATHTAENYRTFLVERLVIEKEEPTLLAALDAICMNEELQSREFNYSYKVGRLQRALSQFFDIGSVDFERVENKVRQRP